MVGGAGDDFFMVQDPAQVVIEAQNEGIDTVEAFISYTLPDWVNDLLVSGTDTISGTGNSIENVITGNNFNNTISGLGGDDTLDGSGGNDVVEGGDGNDIVDGGAGVDTLTGGAGDDTFFVDDSRDLIVEAPNAGIDEVRATADYTLPDWVNNLTLSGNAVAGTGNTIENVITGDGLGNSLSGSDGADTILGNAGDDTIMGNQANDSVLGGEGNDWIHGGQGDDTLLGNQAADTLIGGVGNDSLHGGQGNDQLDGGPGSDTLTGGVGNDAFVFHQMDAGNSDIVTDFFTGMDHIGLDPAVFTALGASGQFSADDPRFYAASGASGGHDADDRVVYDTAGGHLWYDDDGSGPNAAHLVGTLQGDPTLSAADIWGQA